MNIKDKIKLQQWWMEQLRTLTQKTIKEEEKRQERERKKSADLLAEYTSRDEIMDAYGFDAITEKEKDKLLDLWDRSQGEPSELYQAKIALLQDAFSEAKNILRGLEG